MKSRNRFVYFLLFVFTIFLEIMFRKTKILPDYFYYQITDILWAASIFFGFGFLFKKFPTIVIFIFAITVVFSLDFIKFIPGSTMYAIKKTFIYKLFYAYHFPSRNFFTYSASIFLCSIFDIFMTKTKFDAKFYNRLKVIIITTALSIILMLIGLDNNIKIQTYEITIADLPPGLKGLKILHISDLHSTIHKNNQKDLIDKVIQLKPDLIFLTGDIADNNTGFLGTELLLEGIKNVAPLFYTIGNHEVRARDFLEINKRIKSYGVISLENQITKITINNEIVFIGGISDPECYYVDNNISKPADALKSIHTDEKGFKILLSHRPELVDLYKQQNYDLVFSGHAHGGQLQIPFILNGLYSPNQGFFPKYAGGVYSLNNKTNLIVSRGLSISAIPRVFNPPELVLVVLK